jgi:predicted deacetylase
MTKIKLWYIFRLDDISPGMNRNNFEKIEEIFDQYWIKPIIWVVPDNQDPHLDQRNKIDDFWWKIKALQSKWWIIAQHGYQHLYKTKNSGIIWLNNRSEFAGLSYDEQYEMIKKWQEILKQKLWQKSKRWMAPAHSFDTTTLKVLRELWFEYITDGIALYPFTKNELRWLPQQIWKPMKKRVWIWTICLHINSYDQKFIDTIEDFCKTHTENIVNNPEQLSYQATLIQKILWIVYKIYFNFINKMYRAIQRLIEIFSFPYRKSKELAWYGGFKWFIKGCFTLIKHYILFKKYHFDKWHILPIEWRPYAIYTYRYINQYSIWWLIVEVGCWLGEILNKVQSSDKEGYDIFSDVIQWAKFLNKKVSYQIWSFEDIKGKDIEFLITVNFIHWIDWDTLEKHYHNITQKNTIQYIIVDEVQDKNYEYNHKFETILPNSYKLHFKQEWFQGERSILVFKKVDND